MTTIPEGGEYWSVAPDTKKDIPEIILDWEYRFDTQEVQIIH